MLKTIMVKLKTPINRFVDGFNNTFNLAQGKYQNLLGKIINRRALLLLHLLCFGTWLISSTVLLDLSQMRIKGCFMLLFKHRLDLQKNEWYFSKITKNSRRSWRCESFFSRLWNFDWRYGF
jgi:hypothetical protein